MTYSRFKLYDGHRVLIESANPDATEEDRVSLSGYLNRDYVLDLVGSIGTFHISACARSGDYTVTLIYRLQGEVEFFITPATPLIIETAFTQAELVEEEEALLGVRITRGKPSDIELLIYPGEPPPVIPPPEPPDPLDPFLILNAASGVETDVDGNVVSWRDVREGVLTAEFLPTDGVSTLVPSQPEANGQATIKVGDKFTPAALRSTDLGSLFGFMSSGPYTVAMIFRVPDAGGEKTVFSNHLSGFEGNEFFVDGGFRCKHRTFDVIGDLLEAPWGQSTENTIYHESGEHPSKFISVITSYDGAAQSILRLGKSNGNGVVGTTSPPNNTAPLSIGAAADGVAVPSGLELADFRVYNRLMTVEEQDSYVLFAQTEYGVVDVLDLAPPGGAVLMLRANRGISPPVDYTAPAEFDTWQDTREESPHPLQFIPVFDTFPGISWSDARYLRHQLVQLKTKLVYQGVASDFEFMHTGQFTAFIVYNRAGNALDPATSTELLYQVGRYNTASPGINIAMMGDEAFSSKKADVGGAFLVEARIDVDAQLGLEARIATVTGDASSAETKTQVDLDGGRPSLTDFASSTVIASGAVTGVLTLGGNTSFSGGPAECQMVELLIYDFVVSSDQRTALKAYAEQRYGIVSS